MSQPKNKWKWVKLFAFVVIIVCAIGLYMMLRNLHQSVTSNAAMIVSIQKTVEQLETDPRKKETLKLLIDHMGELQDIQSRNLSNDLMSFLYGVLSTVLIGFCVNYVAKCEISATEVLGVKAQLEQENRKAQNSIKLLQIQPAISEAKLALSSKDMTLAKDCCNIYIRQEISNLNKKVKSSAQEFDISSIEQLREALGRLLIHIEKFDRRIEREKNRRIITEDDYDSKHQTAAICKEWINKSIDTCDGMISAINSSETSTTP